MRPPAPAGKARPAWLPGVNARDALPQETLREIAVPLEPRHVPPALPVQKTRDQIRQSFLQIWLPEGVAGGGG